MLSAIKELGEMIIEVEQENPVGGICTRSK